MINSQYIRNTHFILFVHESRVLEYLKSKANEQVFNKHIFNVDVSISTLQDLVIDFSSSVNSHNYLCSRFKEVSKIHSKYEIVDRDYGFFIRELLYILNECVLVTPELDPDEFKKEWTFFLFHLMNFSYKPRLIWEHIDDKSNR